MSYLSDNCTFRMFTPSLVAGGARFVCGDADLDEFFHKDAFLQAGRSETRQAFEYTSDVFRLDRTSGHIELTLNH